MTEAMYQINVACFREHNFDQTQNRPKLGAFSGRPGAWVGSPFFIESDWASFAEKGLTTPFLETVEDGTGGQYLRLKLRCKLCGHDIQRRLDGDRDTHALTAALDEIVAEELHLDLMLQRAAGIGDAPRLITVSLDHLAAKLR